MAMQVPSWGSKLVEARAVWVSSHWKRVALGEKSFSLDPFANPEMVMLCFYLTDQLSWSGEIRKCQLQRPVSRICRSVKGKSVKRADELFTDLNASNDLATNQFLSVKLRWYSKTLLLKAKDLFGSSRISNEKLNQ